MDIQTLVLSHDPDVLPDYKYEIMRKKEPTHYFAHYVPEISMVVLQQKYGNTLITRCLVRWLYKDYK